jgi:predicted O-linked N-acetylglucosamine transferase (SPINDLY family)
MFEIWMQLLSGVPNSVLWLRPRNPIVMRNLQLAAEHSGVAPERIVFAGERASYGEYLARLRRADLFLDTAPYGGHSTAADVLLAGSPIVTLMGNTFASRVCASILIASGLPELVTHSAAEYAALALRLARDTGELQALRAKIARVAPQSPIFDTDRARRNIESAYRWMCERQRAGAPPEAFSIEPEVAGAIRDSGPSAGV